MPASNTYDAILIGGGPAGSCAGAILAEYGHRVLILEREKFPRFHIGESLIPFTYEPLKRIGMIPKMKKSNFVKKYSVAFVRPEGKSSTPFYFHTRYDKDTIAQTWQVLRSEFDQMMLDNAREKGAEVKEEVTVTELIRENGKVVGVQTKNKDGSTAEYRAPITLDCTGKEAWSATRQGWRMRDPYLNKVAVWTYYKGSKREPGIDEGQTMVAYLEDKGWFWHIPQHNDMVSVGVVAEGKYLTRGGVKDPKEIFHREVQQNNWIKEHLSVGESTGVW
ncbi:MAG: tryptophan 7-halogenase [Verrucomicrobia bacterium]|nr:tryptophan 7-halogenase [Verrucomicrobiota bacterium]